jgi:NADH dehydrogenase FAD-containing subunit
MPHTLPHDVVLLGIGHTNAHVLRMWRMQPIPNARLTCISNHPVATYSGMLPGVLAGQYPPEAMEIDLVRLCAAAGARLILGNVIGLDRERHELQFDDRPPLPFDVLSIGIGSVPTRAGLAAADDTLLPIKPMQTFLERPEKWPGYGRDYNVLHLHYRWWSQRR